MGLATNSPLANVIVFSIPVTFSIQIPRNAVVVTKYVVTRRSTRWFCGACVALCSRDGEHSITSPCCHILNEVVIFRRCSNTAHTSRWCACERCRQRNARCPGDIVRVPVTPVIVLFTNERRSVRTTCRCWGESLTSWYTFWLTSGCVPIVLTSGKMWFTLGPTAVR